MRLATQSAYSRARNINAMCRGVSADFEIARRIHGISLRRWALVVRKVEPPGCLRFTTGRRFGEGEFTFSIAYSNYDRDPGNVDIVETPLSFNVGLNDHIELFFKTNGYRGRKGQ